MEKRNNKYNNILPMNTMTKKPLTGLFCNSSLAIRLDGNFSPHLEFCSPNWVLSIARRKKPSPGSTSICILSLSLFWPPYSTPTKITKPYLPIYICALYQDAAEQTRRSLERSSNTTDSYRNQLSSEGIEKLKSASTLKDVAQVPI